MSVAIKLATSRLEDLAPVRPWDETAFVRLLCNIRERRDEFRAQRHISADVITSLQEIGLYRAFVPEQFGGIGMGASDFLDRIERISHADGSAGWVASFAFATKYLSSLPAATLAEIYSDTPDIVFAGAVFPPQPAVKVEGGVRVTGRWSFGSGCLSADLIGVGIRIEGEDGPPLPRMAVMPAKQVRIDPVWDTIGMKGTGSHDLVVEDVFVPDHYILIRGAAPTINTSAYAYPGLCMAAQVLAICGFGAARAALDHVIEISGTARSITGAPSLGDRANVQIHVAECEAKLRAARSWFYAATDAVWTKVSAGHPVPREAVIELRLASSHIARTGAEVARACFEMTGTMGIFSANPLSQYLTDAMVTAQHAFLNEGTFMQAGQGLLGHPPIPGFG
jgi:indole-3-acetate monooxygenase